MFDTMPLANSLVGPRSKRMLNMSQFLDIDMDINHRFLETSWCCLFSNMQNLNHTKLFAGNHPMQLKKICQLVWMWKKVSIWNNTLSEDILPKVYHMYPICMAHGLLCCINLPSVFWSNLVWSAFPTHPSLPEPAVLTKWIEKQKDATEINSKKWSEKTMPTWSSFCWTIQCPALFQMLHIEQTEKSWKRFEDNRLRVCSNRFPVSQSYHN